ncbi:MAG: EAL domain-containing protein [Gammaproteobacteria bacterium]|nr:EAL domain-containing protein [Gammaproteobacteria bacterium]
MTLFKQIIILIAAIFFTLFISTFIVSTHEFRAYLEEQLASHAQDAATSLGIALTSKISEGDVASIEAYTNAMFDSGYYKEIQIKDIDDKVLFYKSLPLTIENVPGWFITLFPLHAPFQEATVEDGWQQHGTIRIQSYLGFAYEKLWHDVWSKIQVYLSVMFVILLILSIALQRLLKPLTAIQHQANAISNREFPTIDIKPGTIEFQQVVTALNKMTVKLKTIFSEQAQLTEDLQKQAFQDGLTGLPNRSIFIKQLKYFCESKTENNHGCLIIMQLNDLVQVNKEYGHIKANDLLKKLADLLNKTSESQNNSLVARLSGSEFAFLIHSISPEMIEKLGNSLQQELSNIAKSLDFGDEDIAHIGMVTSHSNQNMSELLSEADLSLRLAQQKGFNAWHLSDKKLSSVHTQGSDEWYKIITDAIEKDLFQLYFQKTVDTNNQTTFQEVMLRLNYDNQLISAGIFIPMAEHLEITRFIDRWVIEKIILLIKINIQTSYCINISRDTLSDPTFPLWLKDSISQLKTEQQQRLVIEVPEYNVIKSLAEYKNLLTIMEAYQCQFSIDHFGVGFASMSYLQDIKIDYIKIHGSYASNIQDNNDVINFMRQIISTAHNLDIKIIAEGIEKEDDLKVLKTMNLDYYQGYYIGKPSPKESL